MAKKIVWIVRVSCEYDGCDCGRYNYRLYFGKKPERTKRRELWPMNRDHENVCPDVIERVTPERLLPKAGGPAVKVKVVRG